MVDFNFEPLGPNLDGKARPDWPNREKEWSEGPDDCSLAISPGYEVKTDLEDIPYEAETNGYTH